MAPLRLTCCPDAPLGTQGRTDWALFAPHEDGAWVQGPAAAPGGAGRLALLTQPWGTALAEVTRHFEALEIAPEGPLCVLIHGFRYEPRAGGIDNPHRECLSPEGWPARLGLSERGTAVAFGWASDPAYRTGGWRDWVARATGSRDGGWYASAYRRAPVAADGLALTLTALSRVHPDREIDLLAHSLGARVALRALRRMARGHREERAALARTGRVLLLHAAPHWADASRSLRAMAEADAHRPQVLNLIAGRDAVLRRWGARLAGYTEVGQGESVPLLERVRSLVLGGRVLGVHGKPPGTGFRAWMDLALEREALADWAAALDPPLDFRPPGGVATDHRAAVEGDGFMAFCGRVLHERRAYGLPALRWGHGARPPIPAGLSGTGPLEGRRARRGRAWLRWLRRRGGATRSARP